jgi:hypothetical protein
MKLWIATADEYDYDQYDGLVVRAETEADARAQVADEVDPYGGWRQKWDVQPLTVDGPRGILLGSFRAG